MKKISAVGIELSNLCNLSHICRHCYGITGLANTEKLIQISDKSIEILSEELPLVAESITLTGGEPTIYPQKVNNLISKMRLPWMLMTNGVVYRYDFHPKAVLVSLDPPDIRPSIDPEIVIKNVLRYKCNLSVNTVMSKNIDLFSFYKILKKAVFELDKTGHYISEWKISFVIDKGFAIYHPEIFADWDIAFQHLAKFLEIYFQEQPFHLAIRGLFFTKNISENNIPNKFDFSSNPCLDCFHRTLYTTINAEEKVQLCSVARNKAVSIKKGFINAYSKILELPELRILSYNDWKECLDCKWLSVCGCGCPSLAELYGGRWTGKDIIQCKILSYAEKYLLSVLPLTIKKALCLKI